MPRFRRSRRRSGRRRGGLRRFAARITRAGSEPKKIELADELGTNLGQGDTTSRILTILNLPSNLVQGTGESNFAGNSVWLKGVGVRFNASINPGVSDLDKFYIRWTLFKSRSNAGGMLGAGTVYNSGTTDATVPTQVQPLQNPRIFDENTTPGRFVGISYATQFDRTNIKVLKSKLYPINGGGASTGGNCHKFFFPIKRTHQYLNPDDAALTATPNHGRFGSYYLMFQVFHAAGTANISNTIVGIMDWNVDLYFKDP